MSVNHGEAANREPVSVANSDRRVQRTDKDNCLPGFGKARTASKVCSNAEYFAQCGVSGCKSGLDSVSGTQHTSRVRESVCSASNASSVRGATLGKRSSKEIDGQQIMRTLVVANQKGGVGKTATLVHLAFDFAERGLKVAVIDLDTQRNATHTLKAYSAGIFASSLFTENHAVLTTLSSKIGITLIDADSGLANLEKASQADSSRNFNKSIEILNRAGFDLCLVDTPRGLGVSVVSALLSSDAVIAPIELEVYSILGIKDLLTIIGNLSKVNTKLKFLGMVPSKVDSRNPRHGRHLTELKSAYSQLLIPINVGLRTSIADALASGIPVWKIKKTAARKAAQEVKELAQYVFDRMEIAA